jgi:hypothetical protein
MPYPSVLSNVTNPLPSDKLNSPSHSSIHTAENAAINEIQTFVGTLASTAGTLIYDIRSANSNGGGHVQTANKGGTGYTSYTKGDILIASSSSVLSKLAVGLDGQVLAANSSVATGVNWSSANTFTNKVANSTTSSTAGENITTETSIFSTTVSGSILGTSGAVRARLFVSDFQAGGGQSSVWLNANYGGQTVASIVFGSITPQFNSGSKGVIEFDIIANGSATSQKNILNLDLRPNILNDNTGTAFASTLGWRGYKSSVGTVDSNAPQTIGMTVLFNVSGVGTRLTYDGYTIEKIN